MPRNPLAALLSTCLITVALLGVPLPTQAQAAFTTADHAGGGEFAYGTVPGASAPAALGAVLHYLHGRFGAAPQVGRAFQSPDARTFAVFFTLTSKAARSGSLTGLALVSLAQGVNPVAAAIYDDSARFAHTEPALFNALGAAVRSTATAAAASGSASSTVPSLTPTRFPDGSGAVSLPPGWRIVFASHGSAKIVGPRGEQVLLSNTFGPIFDPNNPQVRARLRFANPRQPPLLCPQEDVLQTYLCLVQQNPAHPQVTIRSAHAIPPQRLAVQSVLTELDLDAHDGAGVLACEFGLSITATRPMGDRTLGINGTCAPKAAVAQEQPTLKAVYDSYTLDDRVIAQEFAADAARSRQAGANARVAANNAHAAEDARSAAFEAHMDNIDRMSKSFQNIQLDQTELQDNAHNTRTTVPNSMADALIRGNPNRFESVPTQDFLKGVDY
jgi:hypothetical protein